MDQVRLRCHRATSPNRGFKHDNLPLADCGLFVCLFVCFLHITAPRPFDGRPVELLFVLTGTRRQILHPHPYPHLHLHPHLHPWSQAQICYGLVVAKNSLFSIKMCVYACVRVFWVTLNEAVLCHRHLLAPVWAPPANGHVSS